MSEDEWRELFVERVSDESIDRIDGRAALRATLRPRRTTRGMLQTRTTAFYRLSRLSREARC